MVLSLFTVLLSRDGCKPLAHRIRSSEERQQKQAGHWLVGAMCSWCTGYTSVILRKPELVVLEFIDWHDYLSWKGMFFAAVCYEICMIKVSLLNSQSKHSMFCAQLADDHKTSLCWSSSIADLFGFAHCSIGILCRQTELEWIERGNWRCYQLNKTI